MNMKTRRWRKGVILLQTLVMSVVLSMIAVMVLKWVLGRYMLAARTYRSSKSASHTEGYAGRITSSWNFGGNPGSSGVSMDLQPVNALVPVDAGCPGCPHKIDVSTDEDVITN